MQQGNLQGAASGFMVSARKILMSRDHKAGQLWSNTVFCLSGKHKAGGKDHTHAHARPPWSLAKHRSDRHRAGVALSQKINQNTAELTQFLTHHWKHYGFDFKEFFQQRMEMQNLCKQNLWGPLQFLLWRHITQGHLLSSPHSVIKVWDEEQMQDNKGSLQG